ncbi:toll/interleukin-1 receptor domain-containing protein [uncultured Hymenobacter sp.]|uniref:toll/interleukin-1 receptor domain-containing protein n=1 Tax=uncultured Hymenobacter sp. TaxID=170016 RepID=UPI0035C9C4FF
MPTAALARTSVFISYSHADEKWRKLVEKHLAPLSRDHSLRIWSDQNLKAGEPWFARIKKELATARVGILLVSANFMASDFIHSDELPPLLLAAKQEGVTLLTVVVGHCHFANSPLSKLQAFNKPDKPLEALNTAQRNKEMARLCAMLMKIFGLKAGAVKPAAARAAVPAKAAAPKVPKRITPAAAKTAPTAEAAAKAKAIARRRAIAKNKAAAKDQSAAKPTPNPTAKAAAKKPTPRAKPK